MIATQLTPVEFKGIGKNMAVRDTGLCSVEEPKGIDKAKRDLLGRAIK